MYNIIRFVGEPRTFHSIHVYNDTKGMLQPSQVITESARQAERLKQQRYEKQMDFQQQYENLILEATERIRKERSAIIEENIRSEIRNWIDTYFQQTGKIPDLPSAESGGSRVIFSRQVKYTIHAYAI